MLTRDPVTRAADLAERLVEEVSDADHDWREVERDALALARLAARARGAPHGPGAGGDRTRERISPSRRSC